MAKPILVYNSICGRRNSNQDYCTAVEVSNDTFLSVVADGVGGNKGGEIASTLVVKRVVEFINMLPIDPKTDLKLILNEAFLQAQLVIKEKIKEEPELNGMGTTLVCLLIHKDRCVWGNIGDSRLYIVTRSKCDLVTKDHSYLNQFIEQGNTENIQQIAKRYGHIITKVVNGGKDQPDIYPREVDYYEIRQGDTFVSCSDGLISDKLSISHGWLSEILCSSANLIEFVESIIDYAYQNGSMDNISVSAISYNKFQAHPLVEENRHLSNQKMRIKRFLIFIIILLLVIISFVVGNLVNPQIEIRKFFDTDYKIDSKQNDTLVIE
ncbi:MAG: serine/threonine-protein phosphatase [Bacteroidales bacterium]|nr:serine/threonine-protein phosphatase [Bacteroidales bacterium]